MSNRIFVLQKKVATMDLTAEAGLEGELKENGKVWFDNGRFFYTIQQVEKYLGEWFIEKKEERIELMELKAYRFIGNQRVPENTFIMFPAEKYQAIREAIEFVLNDKSVILEEIKQWADSTKMYTEKEVLDIEEKAFNSGRRIIHGYYPFPQFSDYKNSKQ